ncbi:hypothetical protein FIBSPDRAFT_897017 [Athelia psychrophila]|uniref:Uncharacterized protein n=1 Tax=Athelia psychrophila TaxID=1759441 RepID=A0A166CSE7_9AGAM|nr:hypothetical protein FIBSPDRAFT_897017 [Fibularhizoctonia sp. CBS 109695]
MHMNLAHGRVHDDGVDKAKPGGLCWVVHWNDDELRVVKRAALQIEELSVPRSTPISPHTAHSRKPFTLSATAQTTTSTVSGEGGFEVCATSKPQAGRQSNE